MCIFKNIFKKRYAKVYPEKVGITFIPIKNDEEDKYTEYMSNNKNIIEIPE